METVKVIKTEDRHYTVEVLAPCKGGNVTRFTGLSKSQADIVSDAQKLHRTKLLAHLREVREVLVNRYGADPQKFDPIVE